MLDGWCLTADYHAVWRKVLSTLIRFGNNNESIRPRITFIPDMRITLLAIGLAALFAADRLLKLAAVARFFRRCGPAAPAVWPTVAMIQPLTRGRHDLRRALESRVALEYPAAVRHVLVCDTADGETQALCRELMAAHPGWQATLALAEPDSGMFASKPAKLSAALPHANGEILCFVDDDVTLRPDALRVLVPYLYEAGAAFGLACYTNWSNTWSGLISAFVNANALVSYIPLVYLTEPFTITGHCFALRRDVFEAAGGWNGMRGRLDDDHELARRVRATGLRCVQTPLVYDVDNRIDDARGYHVQMKRWFVFPRQMMLPFLSPWERAVSFVGSAGNLLLPVLALLALVSRRRGPVAAFGAALSVFAAVYAIGERVFLKRSAPKRRWIEILAAGLFAPPHILLALIGGTTVEWRGQRLRVHRGGRFEVLL